MKIDENIRQGVIESLPEAKQINFSLAEKDLATLKLASFDLNCDR